MAKTALTFAHLRLVLVALQTTHAQQPKTGQLQVAMAQHTVMHDGAEGFQKQIQTHMTQKKEKTPHFPKVF